MENSCNANAFFLYSTTFSCCVIVLYHHYHPCHHTLLLNYHKKIDAPTKVIHVCPALPTPKSINSPKNSIFCLGHQQNPTKKTVIDLWWICFLFVYIVVHLTWVVVWAVHTFTLFRFNSNLHQSPRKKYAVYIHSLWNDIVHKAHFLCYYCCCWCDDVDDGSSDTLLFSAAQLCFPAYFCVHTCIIACNILTGHKLQAFNVSSRSHFAKYLFAWHWHHHNRVSRRRRQKWKNQLLFSNIYVAKLNGTYIHLAY